MSLRKLHASHNEDLCNLLIKTTGFDDWVITTAFYSALNLVKHQIFPFSDAGVSYADFDEYYSKLNSGVKISKHSAVISLVSKRIPIAKHIYKMLFDHCNNARYHDYRVKPELAKLARTNLSKLQGICNKT